MNEYILLQTTPTIFEDDLGAVECRYEKWTRFRQRYSSFLIRQPQFGGLAIPLFPNLEDALAAVRIRVHSGS